jgi:predicted MPP superfamily phosphohydrolase
LEELVDRIIELNPDICVITGDLIAYNLKFSTHILLPLRRLTLRVSTYFVLGNHEVELYQFGVEQFLRRLREFGVYTLHNQSTIIQCKNGKFNLVGIGERVGKYFGIPIDIDKSFQDIDESLETIVLVHRPYTVSLIRDYPFSLALSGHNHGGQLTKLGLLGSIIRGEWRYIHGKSELKRDRYIYITSGVGYSRIPIRLFAPSEIALIEIN